MTSPAPASASARNRPIWSVTVPALSEAAWLAVSRPRGRDTASHAASLNAGTVTDQIGRFRALAEAGAGEVIVRLPDPADSSSFECMAKVIAAFR